MIIKESQTRTYPSYDDWNLAMAQRIFSPAQKGRPVYLQVDDEFLTQIGIDFDLPTNQARDFFVRAVQERADLKRQPLEKFFHRRIWEGKVRAGDITIPPPFVGFLGFCVLAGLDMANDSEQGVSAANYYSRFEALLGANCPTKFNEVHTLWERLNRWLDDDLDGAFGRSTARYVNHKHVGYPISQALLRQTDRDKLPQFYARCGLESNEHDVSVEYIQSELQHWCNLTTSPFDQRFKRIFGSDRDTVREVAKMVLAEYEVWDGRTADEIRDGVVSAEILLQLEPDYDTFTCTLYPPTRSRNDTPLPEGRYKYNHRYFELEHDIYSDQWFEPLPDKPFLQQAFTQNDIELSHDKYKLWFKAKPILLFREDDGELGHWVHTKGSPSLNEPYQILCQQKHYSQVEAHLQTCGTFEKVITNHNPIYKEWVWFRNVEFRQLITDADESLNALVPKQRGVTVRFHGGLKLGRGRYLQGGEPSVTVSGLMNEAELFIDDELYTIVSNAKPNIYLAQSDWKVGTHNLRVGEGGQQRHFHIIASGQSRPIMNPLSHHFIQNDKSLQPHTLKMSDFPEECNRSHLHISGAQIQGGEGVSVAVVHPVWVACGNYTRCFVIGRSPHELIEYRLPKSTALMSIVFPVMFKPQWILYAQGNKCRVLAVGSPLAPISPKGNHENHRKWARWVRNAKPPKKKFASIWRAYCKVAKAIK